MARIDDLALLLVADPDHVGTDRPVGLFALVLRDGKVAIVANSTQFREHYSYDLAKPVLIGVRDRPEAIPELLVR